MGRRLQSFFAAATVLTMVAMFGSGSVLASGSVTINPNGISVSGSSGTVNIHVANDGPATIGVTFYNCDQTQQAGTASSQEGGGTRDENFVVPLKQTFDGYTVIVTDSIGTGDTQQYNCQSATQPPTQAATNAPTVPATVAPTQVVTQAPTMAPTTPPTQAATMVPTETWTTTPPQCADGQVPVSKRDPNNETIVYYNGQCMKADQTPESGGYTPTMAPTQPATQPSSSGGGQPPVATPTATSKATQPAGGPGPAQTPSPTLVVTSNGQTTSMSNGKYTVTLTKVTPTAAAATPTAEAASPTSTSVPVNTLPNTGSGWGLGGNTSAIGLLIGAASLLLLGVWFMVRQRRQA